MGLLSLAGVSTQTLGRPDRRGSVSNRLSWAGRSQLGSAIAAPRCEWLPVCRGSASATAGFSEGFPGCDQADGDVVAIRGEHADRHTASAQEEQ